MGVDLVEKLHVAETGVYPSWVRSHTGGGGSVAMIWKIFFQPSSILYLHDKPKDPRSREAALEQ